MIDTFIGPYKLTHPHPHLMHPQNAVSAKTEWMLSKVIQK